MSIFDNTQALAEGWDLFDTEGRIQLSRIDDPANNDLGYDEPKFPSDTEAILFVAKRAMEGSAYHYDAIDSIGMLTETFYADLLEETK